MTLHPSSTGPGLVSPPIDRTVIVTVTKRFSFRGVKFECLNLDGPDGSVWFAKDMKSTVVLTQPSWKELKQAMKEAVDGKKDIH